MTPEAEARAKIDQLLQKAGWVVTEKNAVNLSAGQGIAVREFPLAKDHGTRVDVAVRLINCHTC